MGPLQRTAKSKKMSRHRAVRGRARGLGSRSVRLQHGQLLCWLHERRRRSILRFGAAADGATGQSARLLPPILADVSPPREFGPRSVNPHPRLAEGRGDIIDVGAGIGAQAETTRPRAAISRTSPALSTARVLKAAVETASRDAYLDQAKVLDGPAL